MHFMRIRQCLAVLAAAALILTLLTGCGGGGGGGGGISPSNPLLEVLIDSLTEDTSLSVKTDDQNFNNDVQAAVRQSGNVQTPEAAATVVLAALKQSNPEIVSGSTFAGQLRTLATAGAGAQALDVACVEAGDESAVNDVAVGWKNDLITNLPSDAIFSNLYGGANRNIRYSVSISLANTSNGNVILAILVTAEELEEEPTSPTLECIVLSGAYRTEYFVGEVFSSAGMVVTAQYSNGLSKEVSGFRCTSTTASLDQPFAESSQGLVWVTISYEENGTTVQTNFSVTVRADQVTSITVSTPAETAYIEGQEFNPIGMIITVAYDRGEEKKISICGSADIENAKKLGVSWNPEIMSLGTDAVIISYGGKEATVPVTVEPAELTKIEVTTEPAKTKYNYGETFDPAGMVVTAYYSGGSSRVVKDYNWSPSVPLKEDDTEITILYNEDGKTVSTTVEITVDPGYELIGSTYYVYSASGLRAWAAQIERNSSVNCTLTMDIDFMDQDWTPAGTVGTPYQGTFDGGGYSITGIKDGLLGVLGSDGEVQNLTLENVTLISGKGGVAGTNYGAITGCTVLGLTQETSGNLYIGGIVGSNSGTIADCIVQGEAQGNGRYFGGVAGANNSQGKIEDCRVLAAVVATDVYAGGIAGSNNGRIAECEVAAPVESDKSDVGGIVGYNMMGTITDCVVTGDVSGTYRVGGVAGWSINGAITGCTVSGKVTGSGNLVGGVVGNNEEGGTVTNCSVTGDVTSIGEKIGGVAGANSKGIISACSATGTVSGSSNIGGVVGANINGDVLACYATGAVAGDGNVGGVLGYNTERGTLAACYYTGKSVIGSSAGAVLGKGDSYTVVSGCYWSGSVKGVGSGSGEAIKVEDSWDAILEPINRAIVEWNKENQKNICYWRYKLGSGNPPLLLYKIQ